MLSTARGPLQQVGSFIERSPVRGGLEMLAIGAIAAALAYFNGAAAAWITVGAI
jgi:hypothetical protein